MQLNGGGTHLKKMQQVGWETEARMSYKRWDMASPPTKKGKRKKKKDKKKKGKKRKERHKERRKKRKEIIGW